MVQIQIDPTQAIHNLVNGNRIVGKRGTIAYVQNHGEIFAFLPPSCSPKFKEQTLDKGDIVLDMKYSESVVDEEPIRMVLKKRRVLPPLFERMDLTKAYHNYEERMECLRKEREPKTLKSHIKQSFSTGWKSFSSDPMGSLYQALCTPLQKLSFFLGTRLKKLGKKLRNYSQL